MAQCICLETLYSYLTLEKLVLVVMRLLRLGHLSCARLTILALCAVEELMGIVQGTGTSLMGLRSLGIMAMKDLTSLEVATLNKLVLAAGMVP